MLMQEYCKTRNLTGRETKICRYLPPDLSKLLLAYLALVRPLEMSLALLQAPDEERPLIQRDSQVFLFTIRGKRMTAEQIRAAFCKTMAKYKIDINISGYRLVLFYFFFFLFLFFLSFSFFSF